MSLSPISSTQPSSSAPVRILQTRLLSINSATLILPAVPDHMISRQLTLTNLRLRQVLPIRVAVGMDMVLFRIPLSRNSMPLVTPYSFLRTLEAVITTGLTQLPLIDPAALISLGRLLKEAGQADHCFQ